MFTPTTQNIQDFANKFPGRIQELENLFDRKTNVYIDYANVLPWSDKIGWKLVPKKIKQFLGSFSNVNSVKIYYGTKIGVSSSELTSKDLTKLFGNDFKTKPVKLMRWPIDVSSIPINSTYLIKEFIRKPLFETLTIASIMYLNSHLKNLNDQGITYPEVPKCNFDVEIGVDMLLDYEREKVEHFVLWSGDSDFASPLSQLLGAGKKTTVVSTSRRLTPELNDLRIAGLNVYEINKIRNVLCRGKDRQP